MKCIVIDDDDVAKKIVCQMVINHNELQLDESFNNAIDAIKYLNKNEIDLIFLDIHMKDFSGFDLIQTLKDTFKVILVTSDKSHAIEAFNYSCIIDYLVKPISEERFDQAVDKAKTIEISSKTSSAKQSPQDQNNEKEFYVNIERRLIKIEFDSVTHLSARGDYVLIKTEEKNYIVHSTLKKIEDRLPKDLFIRIHRSHIINRQKIIDIEDNSVLIAKDIIPISRRNRSQLMKQLNLL